MSTNPLLSNEIAVALFLAIPLLAGIGLLGGLAWVWSRASFIEQRLNPYLDRTPERATSRNAASLRAARVRHLARIPGLFLGGATVSKSRERLAEAGHPGGLTPQSFFGLRVLTASAIGVAALVFTSAASGAIDFRLIAFCAAAALIGYRLPALWLARRIQARRGQIEASLPDALDLITVSVEAGLTLEAAIAKLASQLPGALSEELGLVTREIGLGKPRRQALRDLAAKVDVLSLRSFVASVVQANELGSDIGIVLRAQGAAARTRRRQAAQKRALEAPVKIVFPLVLFILPSTFVVILGPAALQVLPQVLGR